MQIKPVILVQSPEEPGVSNEEGVITVIAVYSGEAPLAVSTRRVFDGRTKFSFPTEITEGMTKTRIIYRHTPDQWHELLETCTMPHVQGGLKQVMIPLLKYFQEVYPGKYDDIEQDTEFDPELYAEIVRIK